MAYKLLISFPNRANETGENQKKLPWPGYVASVFVFLGSIIICLGYKVFQTKPKSLGHWQSVSSV